MRVAKLEEFPVDERKRRQHFTLVSNDGAIVKAAGVLKIGAFEKLPLKNGRHRSITVKAFYWARRHIAKDRRNQIPPDCLEISLCVLGA